MYFLNFVEEFWNVKPEYRDWAIGRIEIYRDDEQWAIDELRFSTPSSKEWVKFREEWDLKDLDDLEQFKKLLLRFQCK